MSYCGLFWPLSKQQVYTAYRGRIEVKVRLLKWLGIREEGSPTADAWLACVFFYPIGWQGGQGGEWSAETSSCPTSRIFVGSGRSRKQANVNSKEMTGLEEWWPTLSNVLKGRNEVSPGTLITEKHREFWVLITILHEWSIYCLSREVDSFSSFSSICLEDMVSQCSAVV